jgi:hypothetical protein
MPSKAYASLAGRLADINELMKAHRAVGGKQVGRRFQVVALNRAGVVLLSAHLEGFIENLVEECIELLHTHKVAMGKIPERLRAAQVETTVMKPIPQKDNVAANNRSQELGPILAILWNATTEATDVNLKAKPIISQMNNPGTRDINHLFWYFGIDHVMGTISWQKAGNDGVLAAINELVGRRNAIAHGDPGLKIWKSDVERYRSYVKGVAKALDDIMKAKMIEILTFDPW